MRNANFIQLLLKKWQQNQTTSSKEQTDLWSELTELQQIFLEDTQKIWSASQNYKKGYEPDTAAALARFKNSVTDSEEAKTPKTSMRMLPLRWLGVAAAIAFLVVAGWSYYQWSQPVEVVVQTLAEQTQKVTLPDGSIVVLNEQSVLRYPPSFSSTHRMVKLDGEAFFDVVHNPDSLFTIHTRHTQVTVLGTSFSLRAKPQSTSTEVAVRSGKVQLQGKGTQDAVLLTANEIGTYQHSNQQVKKQTLGSQNIFAWMQHRLTFHKTPLYQVVRDLERYFDINITLQNPQIKFCTYTSLFAQPHLDNILKVLAVAFELEIEKTAADSYKLHGGICK